MMNDEQKNLLKTFFSFDIDRCFNQFVLDNQFIIHKQELKNYLDVIINIPLINFLDYIFNNIPREAIAAADTFQFSDFVDATTRVCSKLYNRNPLGTNFIDMGRMLLDDDIQRKDGALTKYGENHLKTAMLLGLTFKHEKMYYLSAIGYVFQEYEKERKEQLLHRLIIRNKLIRQVILKSSNGTFELESYLYDLSRTTYIRRRTNIKQVLNVLKSSKEYDFTNIFNNIIY